MGFQVNWFQTAFICSTNEQELARIVSWNLGTNQGEKWWIIPVSPQKKQSSWLKFSGHWEGWFQESRVKAWCQQESNISFQSHPTICQIFSPPVTIPYLESHLFYLMQYEKQTLGGKTIFKLLFFSFLCLSSFLVEDFVMAVCYKMPGYGVHAF